MTITGTLLGSPAYMAPEYIAGKPIDARVDIYAFGAMLYQLLTGELPFKGPTPAALLLSITGGVYRAPNELNQAIHLAILAAARNPTHQQKKLSDAGIRAYRDWLDLPISDEEIGKAPFYAPPPDSPEIRYLHERRKALGGYLDRASDPPSGTYG